METASNVPLPAKINLVFTVMMSLVYLAMGIVLLFTELGAEMISAWRMPLGLVLICYGTYRAISAFIKFKNLRRHFAPQD